METERSIGAAPGLTSRSARSCPAQKPRPDPVSSTARMSAPSAARSIARRNSECISGLKEFSYMDAFLGDYATSWEHWRKVRKPVIAAVAGYALGGGNELAMQCDIIIAADNARFGQPEINLGVMPGFGGTQRLPRFTSKAKAMDLCLTERMMDAQEAERAGLVSRVVPLDKLMEEAMAVAEKIAGYSAPVGMMMKGSINRAYETPLAEGVLFERRVFHSQFALEDQKEGMAAFLEKRKPTFKHR